MLLKSATIVAACVGLSVLFGCAAHAQLLRGQDLAPVSLTEALRGTAPGRVILLGEAHEHAPHQAQHLELLRELRRQGWKVNVGMEFLTYPHQAVVDEFVAGRMDEAQFLQQSDWGKGKFQFYRDQILFPAQQGGRTWALNAPRSLSAKVAATGLTALSPEEQLLLPPQFARGNDGYRRRFLKAAGGHLKTPEAAENYFMAQSLWDDTMAWRARWALDQDPQQVLVIIVGEFHVQYGGGLPDRLRARRIQDILTISQLEVEGLSSSEVESELHPDPVDGQRADFLWVSKTPAP